MPSAAAVKRSAACPPGTATGDFAAFLRVLSPKDRQNVERHLAVVEAENDPAHGQNFKKLAACLWALTAHAATTVGQQAIQFFVADGKYRKQQFALEDLRDGKINVYAPDT